MKNMLIIADDLTGACDTAAQFARPGHPVKVSVSGRAVEYAAESAVHAVNTSSRHDDPRTAADKVRALLGREGSGSWDAVYKKTDSVLRGNIGAELSAVLRARPGTSLVYAPAFPPAGRIVRKGILYVNGVPVDKTAFAGDPLCPVTERSVIATLKRQTDCRLIHRPVSETGDSRVEFNETGVIYICDGETDADLQQVAQMCLSSPGSLLFAGPAGFAWHIARLSLESERDAAACRCPGPILCVNGSLNPVSVAQAQAGLHAGFQAAYPDSDIGDAGRSDILLLASPDMAMLHDDPLDALTEGAERLMSRGEFRTLVLFGGETASAVCRALAAETMEITGEIETGVNRGMIDCRGTPVVLIVKSGGFGSRDLLQRLRGGMQT